MYAVIKKSATYISFQILLRFLSVTAAFKYLRNTQRRKSPLKPLIRDSLIVGDWFSSSVALVAKVTRCGMITNIKESWSKKISNYIQRWLKVRALVGPWSADLMKRCESVVLSLTDILCFICIGLLSQWKQKHFL